MATTRPEPPTLGLVIPCFNEEAVVPLLLKELEAFQKKAPFPVRVLFVDDGSTDSSFELLSAASRSNPNFACLRFSRNFGHQTAVYAGLCHASGDVVGVIDADLQDPPEVLLAMVKKWS